MTSLFSANEFFIDDSVSLFGFQESFKNVLGSAGTVAVLVCFPERF